MASHAEKVRDVTSSRRNMEDVIALIDAAAPKPGRPEAKKKRGEEISN